jgi:hypothetical protein
MGIQENVLGRDNHPTDEKKFWAGRKIFFHNVITKIGQLEVDPPLNY